MTKDHDAVRCPQGTAGADIVEVARSQEFRANNTYETDPGEQQQHDQQPPEVRFYEAGHDDQDVKLRHGGPDLDQSLTEEVQATAVKALEGADGDADDGRDDDHREAEEHRDAEAVDHPRHHIPRLIVGSQPMGGGRRRGGGLRQVPGHCRVVVGNQRPDHPALLADQGLDGRIGVVGFRRQYATESGLRIAFEHRRVDTAIVPDQQRAVVGDQLGEERDQEQRQKDPEGPETASVRFEALDPAAVERRQRDAEETILGLPCDGGRRWRCGHGRQVSRLSKSMRGSISV